MPDLPVKIQRVSEVTRLDANNRPQQMISVLWMAGDHGPFTHEFQRAGFDPNAARNTLEAFARGLAQMIPT